MSIPHRLGRLARGFVSNLSDEYLTETIRIGRERGETLKDAFEATWRSAEEWPISGRWARVASSPRYAPKRFPLDVLAAYDRLGLGVGSPLVDVRRKRRELVRRCHPDRFVDPEQRRRAEKLTAEINAAHDLIERYLLRR
ncbi:MAG: hypothetical protein JOZ19_15450 [Rubrobacter sp.]|nr:hypothetical protein [Rubrobacter sp.]